MRQSNANTRERIYHLCFATLLLLGIGLTLIGLFMKSMLPYFQLDAVLTPEELANREKKEATLKLLQKAAGNAWFFGCFAGVSVSAISTIGLWTCRTANRRHKSN